MYTVNNVAAFKDCIAYVGGYAPDKFPQHDWLEPEHRLNLEKAFFLLHEGLGMLCAKTAFKDKRDELKILLDKSYEGLKPEIGIQALIP